MARRRFKRQKFGRKPHRRGRRSFRRAAKRFIKRAKGGIWRGPSNAVIPKFATATLLYTENNIVTSSGTIGNLTWITYAQNDLFDPTVATGGTQPTGFDQYMTYYRSFEVIASKITVIATIPDFTGAVSRYVRLYVVPDLILPAGYAAGEDFVFRNANTHMKIVGDTKSGKPFTILKYYKNTRKLIGRTTADEAFTGTATASPFRTNYWNIGIASDYSAVSTRLYIKIKYYCRFYDKVNELSVS